MERPVKQKQPRDFTTWLKDINIPKSVEHIAYISQDRLSAWLTQITQAAQKFPDFCNTGNDLQDKQEFAAFLTIIGSETEFTYNFPCTHEQGCPDCSHCSYNSNGTECQKNDKLQYFGRGPLQLSWNYNYADFSQSYFGDDRLLKDPTILDNDQTLCWASAMWFWMADHQYGGWCMPQAAWDKFDFCNQKCPEGPFKNCQESVCSKEHWVEAKRNSCHKAMHDENMGIGTVINIINGGYDCCPSTTYFGNFGHTLKRVEWFATILQSWGAGIPWNQIKPVPVQDCPRAKGSIDCTQLSINKECWECCAEIKQQQ